MEDFKAYQAVYSYMFPEVKSAIFDTIVGQNIKSRFRDSHDELLMCGKNSNEFSEKVHDICYLEMQEWFLAHFFRSPEEMDNMHIPILQKWCKYHYYTLPAIKDFTNMYPTAGSEEGIREFMTRLVSEGVERIYVLEGEYEGYKFVGQTRGHMHHNSAHHIEVVTIDINNVEDITPGWFFISNPSARDGNIIPNLLINRICDAGHYVFLDLAYVDCTLHHEFDLSHENIRTVAMSFSKPYGLFYFRFGGLLSKDEVPSLNGNKWFKVVPSILIADTILDQIDPEMLMEKYKPIQKQIVAELSNKYQLPLRCSDVTILAYINSEEKDMIPELARPYIDKFARADGYRFCLTPYFQEWEKNQRK